MTFENRYRWPDRLLHRLAFAAPGVQVALADVEEVLYSRLLADVQVRKPLFVTALPRAGTTILLNLLVGSGEYASHTYEEMPFVLCPMLWHALAGKLRTSDEAQERAHGDGLEISVRSPEAFEEVIWKYFWPRHYKEDRIEVWKTCDDDEFASFFHSHVKKVLVLRGYRPKSPLRYVSKNNMNASRIDSLARLFPEAKIVVPFREPVQHCASLLKQHLSFLEMHRKDPFSRRFMAAIGHYDFGENFRPVNFGNWLGGDRRAEAAGLNFWLEYWIATYTAVSSRIQPSVRLVSYRSLTETPAPVLASLADFLEMQDPSALVRQGTTLRPPRTHAVDVGRLDPRLLDEARELHERLELSVLEAA